LFLTYYNFNVSNSCLAPPPAQPNHRNSNLLLIPPALFL
jgi:hypothetical protein